MPQKKLTVVTDVGTFTRQTARTYTHIVVVKDKRHEVLEAQRVAEMASCRKYAASYRETVRTGVSKDDRTDWHREHTTARIADGSFAKWIEQYDAEAAALEARGPVTADGETPWEVLSWCGRLDLARKEYASKSASYYRHVRIYDVATGQQVRW